MIKKEYQEIYDYCIGISSSDLFMEAEKIMWKGKEQNPINWWEVLTDHELLIVGYTTLQRNFGNLTDKEIISINEAMELTGYPRQSLVRLAKNDTHFIGEILEFVTTSPFTVYQSKRLADLMEQNNLILLKVLDKLNELSLMKGQENTDTKVDTMQNVNSTLREQEQLQPAPSEVSQKGEGSKSSSVQEKLNAIKSKINIQPKDNAV